jgi:fatty acyl-CoA reductase
MKVVCKSQKTSLDQLDIHFMGRSKEEVIFHHILSLESLVLDRTIIMEKTPSVRNFFHGKTIFLTGATGFLGKMVVEKLLTSCEVKKIFILIREKRGQSVQERCNSFFNDQLFKFRTDVKKLRATLEPIAGDISEEDLGVSSIDRKKITSEVDIIIHSAASVKFDEPLR